MIYLQHAFARFDVLKGDNRTSWIILLVPVSIILTVLLTTRIVSTTRYRLQLSRFLQNSRKGEALSPPLIPYTIPFLGHAHGQAWLNPKIGGFWEQLFHTYPRTSGACKLLMGGQTIDILFSSSAIEAMLKIKKPNRLGFALQIVENVLGMNKQQFEHHMGFEDAPMPEWGMKSWERLEAISHNYLLKKDAVNDLTSEFYQSFQQQLTASTLSRTEKQSASFETGLITWLQPVMFRASMNATFGTRLLELYPKFETEFFEFDQAMQSLFFGKPKFLDPKPYNDRDTCLEGLERWHKALLAESKGEIPDPDGPVAWDPLLGSRYARARFEHHNQRGMTTRSRAGLDLGFSVALAGNAIPATMWMILHILDPEGDTTLYGRVMAEIESVQLKDGALDLQALMSLPLLQSIYEEVLRLYHDAIITRNLTEDIILPLDNESNRTVLLKDGATVMAPSWLGHRDDASWNSPPANQFYAERFLKQDPESGKTTFSTVGTAGKLFPYGGGKTMCPGRVFAKQEMLAAVATVLSTFEVDCVGCVDAKGKYTRKFPGLRDANIGSVVLSATGDMLVRVRQRS